MLEEKKKHLHSTAAANAASGKENSAAAPAPAPAAPAAPAPATQQLTPLDDAAAIMRSLGVIQPWGSFDVAFFPNDKLVLRSVQKAGASSANVKELVVPVSSVRAVAVLDAVPEEQAAFVLLGLKPALSIPWASAAMLAKGDGELDCLALRIPNSAPEESLSFSGNPLPIQGNRAIVLCAALGKAGVPPSAFLAPDPSVFSNAAAASSSANGSSGRGSGNGGGGCSVRAAVKASQGHLFPLGDRAIAFVKKPAFLVSLKSLRAAELARVGTGSASFDLLLHLKASSSSTPGGAAEKEERKVLEFGQIPRQELAPLRKWLEERGVPLGASAEEGGAGEGKRKAAAGAEEEESDDDEASSSDDDEDFDPKAAAEELKAREEEEDDAEEGDGDEGEEEAGESSSDDDDEGQDRPAKKNKF